MRLPGNNAIQIIYPLYLRICAEYMCFFERLCIDNERFAFYTTFS